MESKLPDRSNDTNCKNCIFAIYHDKTQTGCSASRLEKFSKDDVVEAYDNEKEFYVIKRICNLYRNLSWNNGVADVDKAINEILVRYDFIIEVDEESDYNRLDQILSDFPYKKSCISFSIMHKHNLDIKYKKNVVALWKKHQIPVSVFWEKDVHIHEYLMVSKKTYHVVANNSNLEDSVNALTKLNKRINENLEKILIYKYNNTILYSNYAYKIQTHKVKSESLLSLYSAKQYSKIIDGVLELSKELNLYTEENG